MDGRLITCFPPPTPACLYWILCNFENKFNNTGTSADANNCGFCLNNVYQHAQQPEEKEEKA